MAVPILSSWIRKFHGLTQTKNDLSCVCCSPYTKWKRMVSFTTNLTPRKVCPINTDQNASWTPELVWAVRRIKKAYPSRELNPDSSLIHPAVQSVFKLTENY